MKTLALLVALLLAAVPVFGATIPGTIVASKVTTGNTANTFSIGDTGEMLGTTKQVPNSTSMMAITPERRSIGMTCYVVDEDNEYRLVGGIDNTNWVLLQHYVPQPPPTPVTNYIIAGWWTNDTFIQEYFRTNIWIDQYMSNWFATNYNVYSWPTNIYTTNIIDLDNYISNYWATNWSVFPNYVSNYFWTNITAAVTNIIYNWASSPVNFDSITVTNGITNLSLTPLTLLSAGGAKRIVSIPNAAGYIYNNGSGTFSYQDVETIISNYWYIKNGDLIISNLYVIRSLIFTNYGTLATATNTAPTASGTNQWLMTLASDGAVTNTTGPGWVTYTLSSGTTNRYYWIGQSWWRPIGNATSNDAPAGVLFIPSNKVAKLDIENLAGQTNYSCAVQRP